MLLSAFQTVIHSCRGSERDWVVPKQWLSHRLPSSSFFSWFPVYSLYGLQVNELVTATWVKPRILDPATGRFEWTPLVGKPLGKPPGLDVFGICLDIVDWIDCIPQNLGLDSEMFRFRARNWSKISKCRDFWWNLKEKNPKAGWSQAAKMMVDDWLFVNRPKISKDRILTLPSLPSLLRCLQNPSHYDLSGAHRPDARAYGCMGFTDRLQWEPNCGKWRRIMSCCCIAFEYEMNRC